MHQDHCAISVGIFGNALRPSIQLERRINRVAAVGDLTGHINFKHNTMTYVKFLPELTIDFSAIVVNLITLFLLNNRTGNSAFFAKGFTVSYSARKKEAVMNKITQRSLRDLHSTIPAGTECYLCSAVRSALAQYRKGAEPASFVEKEQALSLLTKRLGRGLKRFFVEDIRNNLSGHHGKMA